MMINVISSIRRFLVEISGMLLGDRLGGESSGFLSSIIGGLSWTAGIKLNKKIDEQIRENDTSSMSYEPMSYDQYFKYRSDHAERLKREQTEQTIYPKM